ncbi:MAG TPA: energy transducer TonB [Aeromonadales bacterium]|nr:energy transducer TonB [Aeromonadales bacterium]
MKRYLTSAGFAIVVVTAIFLLMIKLIQQEVPAKPVTKAVDLNLDLIIEKDPIPKPHRKPPEKKEIKDPPKAPQNQPDDSTKVKISQVVKLTIDSESIVPGLNNGGGNSDQMLTPVVTIEPQYPAVALRENKEGWVTLGFTVTRSGTVTNVKVLNAKPRRVFDKAALRALYKWKYRPEIVDGQAVESPDQVVTLQFNLEDS